ncbi:MAG: DAK2 domain-containing protein [Clostridiales bacterium]|nr:DAK2 domain-containing protein [Clostridiales bacterium]
MNHTESIDGNLLHRLLLAGYENLNGSIQYLNTINVFPVSDGDTGNNMKRTYEMGVQQLRLSDSWFAVFSSFMQGVLIGSRGNSGSILSQYFHGLFDATRHMDSVSVPEFCRALQHAYKLAYRAVLRPVEGTMLTVMRESIEAAAARMQEDTSLEQFLGILTAEMFQSVQSTTGRLEVLRANNVVDSGAAGIYLIFDGMKNGLYNSETTGHAVFAGAQSVQSAQEALPYRYCTEFLLKTQSTLPREHYVNLLEMKGDSLIVTRSEDILKVHIHTNEPQNILDAFSAFGAYVETKVDDMLLQQELTQYSPLQRKHEGYVILSFVHGDGIIEAFEALGCDIAFTATQNYHVDEDNFRLFIDKFMDEDIVLLPNDEKIYDTARRLYPADAYPNLHIINAQNVMQSYFLLSLMLGTDELPSVLKSFAAQENTPCYVAKILSIAIARERYYVGFTASRTIIHRELGALLREIAGAARMAPYTTLVVFHGQTAAEEDSAQLSAFFAQYAELDFAMMDGKQDDFDYIIGAM